MAANNSNKREAFDALVKEEEAAIADVTRAHTTLVTAQASVAAASPKNAENAVCGWQRAFAPCEKVV